MPYLGHPPHSGEDNNFKILDTISSYTFTFDGSDSGVVSTSNETIYSVDHRFITGQRVKYTNGGGGDINGLTNNSYYFIIKQDKNNIQLATSAANAISGTAINITAVGSGTSHTLNVAFDGVNTKFKATHTSGQKARITRASQLVLSVNGVIQQPHDSTSPSTGFGIDSSNIVFSQAPASTDAFWGHILTNNNVTFDISDNKVDHFSGDGSTVAFTLSKSPSNNENVLVTIDGVVQYPNDGAGNIRAYSVNVNVISFTTAPGSGTQIEVRHIGFAGATTGDTVTGFYGRTGNASLKNTDNITVNDAAITGNATVTGNTTITGDLTVNGTTTTLDTKLTEVDQLLVAANNSTVAVAVTQSGAGDILNLFDATTEVLTVTDGGKVGIGTGTPSEIFHIRKNDTTGPTITLQNSANKTYINNWGSNGPSGRQNRFEINATSATSLAFGAPYIAFATGGIGDSNEKLRITSAGRVGINSTIPADLLTIGVGANTLAFGAKDTNRGNHIWQLLNNDNSGNAEFRMYKNSVTGTHAQSINFATSGDANYILDGNFGIGIANPDGNLHLHNSTAGSVTAATDANELILESAANVGMTFLTANDSISRIKFGDTTATNRGIFYFNHSDASFNFQHGSDNRLKIDSDGQMGLGITPVKPFNIVAGVGTTEFIRLSQPVDSSVQQNFGIGWCSNNNHVWPGSQITSLEYDVSDTRRSLLFYTRGTNQDIAPTERMRISHDGNVAIGTDGYGNVAPLAPLHVSSYSPTTAITDHNTLRGASQLVLQTSNNVNNSRSGLMFSGALHSTDGCSAGIIGNHENVAENSEQTSLSFYTSHSETLGERLRIASTGYTAISHNATTPAHRLHVTDNAATNSVVLFDNPHTSSALSGNTAATAAPHALCLENSNTTVGNIVSLGFQNRTGGSWANAAITSKSMDTSGNADMTFWTESSNTILERLKITSGGTVHTKMTGTPPTWLGETFACREKFSVFQGANFGEACFNVDVDNGQSFLSHNLYYNSGWKTKKTSNASLQLELGGDGYRFRTGTDGGNDGASTLTTRLQITSAGRIDILGESQQTGFHLSNKYGQAGIFGGMYYNGSAWVRSAAGSRKGSGMYVNTGGYIGMLFASDTSGTSATMKEYMQFGEGHQNAGQIEIRGAASSTAGPMLTLQDSETSGTPSSTFTTTSVGGLIINADSGNDVNGSYIQFKQDNANKWLMQDNDFKSSLNGITEPPAALLGSYHSENAHSHDGTVDCTNIICGNFQILEVFGRVNPNTAGSGAYSDPIHMYIYHGIGWNGAVKSFIYSRHVAPPARDAFTSGSGLNGNNVSVVWYDGSSESTECSTNSSSHYVRFKLHGFNATYGPNFAIRVFKRF